jgi:D-glycero-D-manno-heptose 1,7-bisphosphate phosphatase
MADPDCGTPAILLDRDGTLMYDTGYPKDPSEVRLIPDVCEALGQLHAQGYALVIISNQSGVGRGMMTIDQVQSVHARLEECLAGGGVRLDGVYYCYDSPSAASEFRKPGTGMLLQAQRELGLCLAKSFMIGDKGSDVEAGKKVGCRTILFRLEDDTASPALPEADHVATSWPQVVEIVSEYENA